MRIAISSRRLQKPCSPSPFSSQVTLRMVEPRRVRSSQSTSSLRVPSVWMTRMSFLQSATRVTDQTLPPLHETANPCITIRLTCFKQGRWTKIFLCRETVAPPPSHMYSCWPRVKSCQNVTSWCFRILRPLSLFVRNKKKIH